jgi:voltage-gated potassium channel
MFKDNTYTQAKTYKWTMAALAVVAIVLIILDFASVIDINGENSKWFWVNNLILVIFAIDYFWRLHFAKDKRAFVRDNIFDLLAIIPVGVAFSWMKFAQVSDVYLYFRLLRLIRLAGLIGKLREVLHTNGILYMLYFSIAFMMLGAVAFSITEHVPLNQAFWWAITTASTVGYGDISTHTIVPHTMMGQFVVLVMIIIGVGMMGMVSSSLTTYFMRKNSVTTQSETQKSLNLILKKLNQLEKNDDLAQQNEDLKEQIQAIKEQQNSSE